MRLGDFFEWLGAAAIIAAAYIWSGVVLSLAVVGVWLLYQAECHDGARITLPHRRTKTSALDGIAIWRCDRCGGEHHLGLQAGHVCQVAS